MPAGPDWWLWGGGRYADSFQWAGTYVDTTPQDALGRRTTHIVAIDALASPGNRQWAASYRLR